MTKPLGLKVCHVEVATGDELAIPAYRASFGFHFELSNFGTCKKPRNVVQCLARRKSVHLLTSAQPPNMIAHAAIGEAQPEPDVGLGKDMQAVKEQGSFLASQGPNSLAHTPQSRWFSAHPLHITIQTRFCLSILLQLCWCAEIVAGSMLLLLSTSDLGVSDPVSVLFCAPDPWRWRRAWFYI